MLSNEYAALVRRDQRIPGLATILDPNRFVMALSRLWPDVELALSGLDYIRYKPGVSCLAVHRLTLSGTSVTLTAKAYGDEAVSKIEKAHERPAVSGAFGKGRLFLERERIVVSLFPNDAKLRSLALLESRDSRRRLLSRVLPERPWFWNGSLTPLAYKPERRYVVRVEGEDDTHCVLKFHTGARFAPAYRAAGALARSLALQVPRRIGRSQKHRVVALDWLPGVCLRDALAQRLDSVRKVEATGGALARIHTQEVENLTVRSRAIEAETLRSLSERLGYLLPSLSGRAQAVTQRLEAWLTAQPTPSTPIHGDFYDKQVLFHEDRVSIIDLDGLVVGDPRADLGLLLAHFEANVARGLLSSEDRETLARAFVRGYEEVTQKPVPRGVSLYVAIGLLQLSHGPFRRGEHAWAERTVELLQRAERYCDYGDLSERRLRWTS